MLSAPSIRLVKNRRVQQPLIEIFRVDRAPRFGIVAKRRRRVIREERGRPRPRWSTDDLLRRTGRDYRPQKKKQPHSFHALTSRLETNRSIGYIADSRRAQARRAGMFCSNGTQ